MKFFNDRNSIVALCVFLLLANCIFSPDIIYVYPGNCLVLSPTHSSGIYLTGITIHIFAKNEIIFVRFRLNISLPCYSERFCLRISNIITPAATELFKESKVPNIGIEIITSHSLRTRGLIPCPSLPTMMQTGESKSVL